MRNTHEHFWVVLMCGKLFKEQENCTETSPKEHKKFYLLTPTIIKYIQHFHLVHPDVNRKENFPYDYIQKIFLFNHNVISRDKKFIKL